MFHYGIRDLNELGIVDPQSEACSRHLPAETLRGLRLEGEGHIHIGAKPRHAVEK
jgi:hypothetical protein